MTMKELKYTVTFHTPAFLGNAEQSGQWRTPPFKALLRQWWRVVYAADCGFQVNTAEMRRAEGLLFGNAWLSHREGNRDVTDYSKSLVRLRLEATSDSKGEIWAIGGQRGVAPLSTGLDTSYAWFGLINRGGGQPVRTAIKVEKGEASRLLRIAVPEHQELVIRNALRLIGSFGQLGSRSRGGWGSVGVDGIEPIGKDEISRYVRPIETCLEGDWPMSLASDETGILLWEGKMLYDTWDKAMHAVAIERKKVRTALKSVAGRDLRSALGFATPGRMPSPLRWKIIPNGNGKLTIRIFAMPHGLPKDSGKSLPSSQLEQAWQEVCNTLDRSNIVARCK